MNAIEKLLSVAKSEVGYLEKASNNNLESKTANAGDKNYTKYANDFDTKYPNFYNGKKNGFAWCDMFVDWCMCKAFGVELAREMLGQPQKSCGAGCTFSAQYYKQMMRFGKTAHIGDQIFFVDNSGNVCHTGIVYNVDDTYVYTIEGNTSSEAGVVANGGSVAKKKYKLNSKSIYGYGTPNYSLYKEEKQLPKLDNTPDNYAKKDIEWAVKNGLIVGNAEGNLMLHSNITRQDFLVILHRYDEYKSK